MHIIGLCQNEYAPPHRGSLRPPKQVHRQPVGCRPAACTRAVVKRGECRPR
jgi:hypothetical protein